MIELTAKKVKVLGIGGLARAGKDTFVKIAKNMLQNNGYRPFRLAFADELKREVNAVLLQNNFSFDVYTENPLEKKFIRDLLVWWAVARRNESNGQYWIDKVKLQMQKIMDLYSDDKDNLVFLISDVRYENEAMWLHEIGGWFVHLKRYQLESSDELLLNNIKMFDKAPNAEEAYQDPLIQKVADYFVEWENKGPLDPNEAPNSEYLKDIVLSTLNKCPCFTLKLFQ